MSDNRAIGVFDSGLGGLTVVKELKKVLPGESVVYFGDTGRVPYGNKSREIIRRYAQQDERLLLSHGVKLIIAACGTVSSVAKDTEKELPVPFVEVVSHASAAAVKATKNGKIGVIGTVATIKSHAHKNYILGRMPDAEVYQNSCPLFVPLVEEGITSENDMMALEAAKRYLTPRIEKGVDTLILGCTHYPVLSDVLKKVCGDGVKLINMGEATAAYVKQYLTENDMLSNRDAAADRYLVSDKSESFSEMARALLGSEDIEAETVDIEKI